MAKAAPAQAAKKKGVKKKAVAVKKTPAKKTTARAKKTPTAAPATKKAQKAKAAARAKKAPALGAVALPRKEATAAAPVQKQAVLAETGLVLGAPLAHAHGVATHGVATQSNARQLQSVPQPQSERGQPPQDGGFGVGWRRKRRRRRGKNRFRELGPDGLPLPPAAPQQVDPNHIPRSQRPDLRTPEERAAAEARKVERLAQQPPKRQGNAPPRVPLAGDALMHEVARRLGARTMHAEQIKAVKSVLDGKDTLVVLPTGFGKSLIYQVPSMMATRPTIVISPLIALMRDQEQSLRQRFVPVVRLDSTLHAETRRQTIARIRKGGKLVILTTPESLHADDARAAFMQARPALLCIDEAHCLSEWGHDFRPAYLRLGIAREALGITTTLALTATATPSVRNDIAKKLRMSEPTLVLSPPQRENIRLAVHQVEGNTKIERTGQLIRALPRPGILYCATTKAVDEIYAALTRAKILCARYHGGMSAQQRTSEQRRFMRDGKRMVMVATSAFGMGIDKADIRAIVHYQVPGSLEQYVQESGRAGRDGLPSECILLFDAKDLEIHRFLKRTTRPSSDQLFRVADALAAWAGEGKAVSGKDLALSAGVPAVTCHALTGQLEELGVIAHDAERRYVSTVPAEDLKSRSHDLIARFERQKIEDDRRLTSMEQYATTTDCRSVFIRRWFGESEPPACGHCDRCLPKAINLKPLRPSRPASRRKRSGRR